MKTKLRLNLNRMRKAANQVGIVIIAGGIVHGIISNGGTKAILELVGLGLVLIFISSVEGNK